MADNVEELAFELDDGLGMDCELEPDDAGYEDLRDLEIAAAAGAAGLLRVTDPGYPADYSGEPLPLSLLLPARPGRWRVRVLWATFRLDGAESVRADGLEAWHAESGEPDSGDIWFVQETCASSDTGMVGLFVEAEYPAGGWPATGWPPGPHASLRGHAAVVPSGWGAGAYPVACQFDDRGLATAIQVDFELTAGALPPERIEELIRSGGVHTFTCGAADARAEALAAENNRPAWDG